MSWIGPIAKRGVKYGVKYGPQVKILWDTGGKHVQAAARNRAGAAWARRTAFQKAETVVTGSVLKQIDAGKPVWVVYAGDELVDAFPRPSVALAQLVEHADLSARVTTEDHRAQQLRQRARRAQERLTLRKGAGGVASGGLEPEAGTSSARASHECSLGSCGPGHLTSEYRC